MWARISLDLMIGTLIDRIKINRLSRENRNGHIVWRKKRRLGSALLIASANRFFRAVGNPVEVLRTGRKWQRWEVDSFLLLNGDAFRAEAIGSDTVVADELPGHSLCSLVDKKALTAAMMASAGTELRRAHEHVVPYFEGPWSHGDPHLGNFIFDPLTSRSRLIDFEVQHLKNLSAADRHVADLLVPLLDLMGRCEQELWVPYCRSFLAAYGSPELVDRLKLQLTPPRGSARAWWAIRTAYISRLLVCSRLEELRISLEETP